MCVSGREGEKAHEDGPDVEVTWHMLMAAAMALGFLTKMGA